MPNLKKVHKFSLAHALVPKEPNRRIAVKTCRSVKRQKVDSCYNGQYLTLYTGRVSIMIVSQEVDIMIQRIPEID